MPDSRPLLAASLAGLLAALALGVAASVEWGGAAARFGWGAAHTAIALYGFLLPGLAFLVWQVAGPLLPRALGSSALPAALWAWGALVLALGTGLPAEGAAAWLPMLGHLVLAAAGGIQAGRVLRATPRRGETVVDVARDPLTKGDDASLKHVRFAHMAFLPLPLLALTVAAAPLDWTGREELRLAAMHWLLAGHALLLTYGLSHLVVPRLSGVPAIAAGAVKGELHSSLLGLLLLALGFLLHSTALLVAGGASMFLGAFVFMGVLGANIMKNKSPTQRVTPQFAYVPWTFAGVFWLVAGVLLGLFLTAARVRFPDLVPGLAFVHVHATLLGGFAMLLLGYATRTLPAAAGRAPVPFSRSQWAFYGLNVGLLLLVYGRLLPEATLGIRGTAAQAPIFLLGGALAAVSVAAWFKTLASAVGVARAKP